MKIARKILLTFFIIALIFLASLCGIGLYYYHHPAAAKAFIEKSIARSTHTSFRIEKLSYSLKPLKIRAEGIIFEPGKDHRGFHLKIPKITADMTLEGSFGNKTLTFKKLKIEGFSCRISHDMILPKIESKSKRPSFLNNILKKALAFFLFRDIQFEATQISKGHMLVKIEEQTVRITNINAYLNEDHLVEISCGTSFLWPSREIRFIAPHLLMTTTRGISLVDPEIRCLLTATGSAFQSPEVDVKAMGLKVKMVFNRENNILTVESSELNFEVVLLKQPGVRVKKVESKIQLIYDHNHNKLIFGPVDFFTKGVVFDRTCAIESLPLDFNLKTQGSFDLAKSVLNLSSFNFVIPDIVSFKGKIDASFGIETALMLELSNGSLFPQKMMPFIPSGLRAQLKHVTLSGPALLNGKVNGVKKKDSWDLDVDLRAWLKGNRFSYAAEGMKMSSDITGYILAQGELPDIKIAVNINADRTFLSGRGVGVKPFQIGLTFSGEYPVFEIDELKASVPRISVKTKKKDILINSTRMIIKKGTIDAKKRSINIPEIRLESSLLKNLLVALNVDGEQMTLAIKGKQTNIMESAQSLNLIPFGWQISGIDSIQLRATQRQTNIWTFASELGLQDLAFESKDSTCAGEKIALNATISGEVDLKKISVVSKITLEINEGEALYDRFYIDLGMHPFAFFCDAAYQVPEKFLELSALKIRIKDILECHMHGNILNRPRDQRIHLSLNILKTPMKPVFDKFVLEPFQMEKPILADLTIEGDFSADLKLKGAGKNWTASGHLLWHDGKLLSADNNFSFQGIDLNLPISYRSHEDGKLMEQANGNLFVRSMRLPVLPVQPLTIKIDASPNSLSIKSPTVINIPGGSVRIGPIACKDIFSKQPAIHTSLSVNAVAIHPLLSEIWQQPVKGGINGKLDSIIFKGKNLTTDGNIKANVFDGEIVFSDLGASGIFSSTPVFRMSVRMNALRLAKMTSGTPFGKIEGVLDGYVKDLEVAYGQPQKFDLALETIPTKGVSQRISVKAVDNIARIGGGQSPFVGLAGGFAMLFKEFPYKKIGVRASLENDVFKVNGTIREGGKEYIIKRGGLLGVDIVNQNPDNRASFKDMVKRIKRVTADRGGPDIR